MNCACLFQRLAPPNSEAYVEGAFHTSQGITFLADMIPFPCSPQGIIAFPCPPTTSCFQRTCFLSPAERLAETIAMSPSPSPTSSPLPIGYHEPQAANSTCHAIWLSSSIFVPAALVLLLVAAAAVLLLNIPRRPIIEVILSVLLSDVCALIARICFPSAAVRSAFSVPRYRNLQSLSLSRSYSSATISGSGSRLSQISSSTMSLVARGSRMTLMCESMPMSAFSVGSLR